MNQLSERAQALRAQMLASVTPAAKAVRKTVKGQRAAAKVAKAGKVAKATKSAKAVAKETMTEVLGQALPASFSQWLKWQKGINLAEFVSSWKLSLFRYAIAGSFKGAVDMFDEDTRELFFTYSVLEAEHAAYRNARFNEPIRFNGTEGNAFDKIVARESALEREGKHDLGLLGYSAIDRVQIAVHYAWVKNVIRYLSQTGAYTPVAHFIPGYKPVKATALTKDEKALLTQEEKTALRKESLAQAASTKAANIASGKAYLDELGQALRDLRSDDELRQLAQLASRSRYTVSGEHANGSPRIRKQSQTEAVIQAARWLELRAEFNAMPVAEYAKAALKAVYSKDVSSLSHEASSFLPTVGGVYKEIKAVTKEGMRQFRNTLEGLTQDGVISDATQFIASHRQDLVSDGMDRMVAKLDASLKRLDPEDELFERHNLDESFIKRRAVATVALELPNHTEAEANAKVAMQMLVEGMTLSELRESFSDLSEVAFGRLFTDSAIIAEEVQASDIFRVKFFDMVEEAVTAAFTA
jgi:hypothetical protein